MRCLATSLLYAQRDLTETSYLAQVSASRPHPGHDITLAKKCTAYSIEAIASAEVDDGFDNVHSTLFASAIYGVGCEVDVGLTQTKEVHIPGGHQNLSG